MKTAHINENGLAQIAAGLGEYHKLGRDHFTREMLGAWAEDAENSFAHGNGCEFEIGATESASGAPVIVSITPAGFDVEEFE